MYRRIPAKNVYNPKSRYKTKKPIRGFRDLEIYQKAQKAAVEITKTIRPFLGDKSYGYEKEFCELALNIPLQIVDAHTQRFTQPEKAMETLNNVISNCNKMIVYLEQIKNIYTQRAEKTKKDGKEDDKKEDGNTIELTEANKIFLLCDEIILILKVHVPSRLLTYRIQII